MRAGEQHLRLNRKWPATGQHIGSTPGGTAKMAHSPQAAWHQQAELLKVYGAVVVAVGFIHERPDLGVRRRVAELPEQQPDLTVVDVATAVPV